MYNALVERYVARFFEQTVHVIPTYIDGGYNGPNLSPLPKGVVFGDNIIITGESSIRDVTPMRTTGKTGYLVDIATHLQLDTLIDGKPNQEMNDKKLSGDHVAFIEAKTGATLRTEAQGRTIKDEWLRAVLEEKPEADNIIACFRDEDDFEARNIEILEYYIRLIEIYGVQKVTVIRLVKA